MEKLYIIERINLTNEHEKALPPPTKLKATSFVHVATMFPAPITKIGIFHLSTTTAYA